MMFKSFVELNDEEYDDPADIEYNQIKRGGMYDGEGGLIKPQYTATPAKIYPNDEQSNIQKSVELDKIYSKIKEMYPQYYAFLPDKKSIIFKFSWNNFDSNSLFNYLVRQAKQKFDQNPPQQKHIELINWLNAFGQTKNRTKNQMQKIYSNNPFVQWPDENENNFRYSDGKRSVLNAIANKTRRPVSEEETAAIPDDLSDRLAVQLIDLLNAKL